MSDIWKLHSLKWTQLLGCVLYIQRISSITKYFEIMICWSYQSYTFLSLINLLLFSKSNKPFIIYLKLCIHVSENLKKKNNLEISRIYSSLNCVYCQQHIIKIQTFHVTFLHSPCPLWPPRPWFCHALCGMQSLPVVFQEFLPSRLL